MQLPSSREASPCTYVCLTEVMPLLAYEVHLVTHSDPIKYLLTRSALLERIVKWLLLLVEFDISIITPKAIKSQALADFLAQLLSQHGEVICDVIPGEFYVESLLASVEEGE